MKDDRKKGESDMANEVSQAALRKKALARITGPGAEVVLKVAKELGVKPWKLYAWRKQRDEAAKAMRVPKASQILNFADGVATGSVLTVIQHAVNQLNKREDISRDDIATFVGIVDSALQELRNLV